MAKADKYERIEVLFNKTDKIDIELYEFLKQEAIIVGDARYLKQLLYNHMKNKNKD